MFQFKVATFTLDEEVGGAGIPPATPTEGKALLLSPTPQQTERRRRRGRREQQGWEEIIPAGLLREVEEEERGKEELQLYLPPRQRTVQVVASPFHNTFKTFTVLMMANCLFKTSLNGSFILNKWHISG